MSKHTPGPWHVTAGHRSIRPSFISPGENGGFAICEMYADGRDFTANARLIAAAPELLEALEEAVACGMVPVSSVHEGGAVGYSRQVKCADMIRAAIAKARGQA